MKSTVIKGYVTLWENSLISYKATVRCAGTDTQPPFHHGFQVRCSVQRVNRDLTRIVVLNASGCMCSSSPPSTRNFPVQIWTCFTFHFAFSVFPSGLPWSRHFDLSVTDAGLPSSMGSSAWHPRVSRLSFAEYSGRQNSFPSNQYVISQYACCT